MYFKLSKVEIIKFFILALCFTFCFFKVSSAFDGSRGELSYLEENKWSGVEVLFKSSNKVRSYYNTKNPFDKDRCFEYSPNLKFCSPLYLIPPVSLKIKILPENKVLISWISLNFKHTIYQLQRRKEGEGFVFIREIIGSKKGEYIDSGLEKGSVYFYRLRVGWLGKDGIFKFSRWSKEISVRLGGQGRKEKERLMFFYNKALDLETSALPLSLHLRGVEVFDAPQIVIKHSLQNSGLGEKVSIKPPQFRFNILFSLKKGVSVYITVRTGMQFDFMERALTAPVRA